MKTIVRDLTVIRKKSYLIHIIRGHRKPVDILKQSMGKREKAKTSWWMAEPPLPSTLCKHGLHPLMQKACMVDHVAALHTCRAEVWWCSAQGAPTTLVICFSFLLVGGRHLFSFTSTVLYFQNGLYPLQCVAELSSISYIMVTTMGCLSTYPATFASLSRVSPSNQRETTNTQERHPSTPPQDPLWAWLPLSTLTSSKLCF